MRMMQMTNFLFDTKKKPMNEQNIEKFESLLRGVGREGIGNLIEFIRKSDFYTAPASTKYHSCHEGGLLEHTLNVYNCLIS